MKPADLALPARFSTFRKGQAEIAIEVACSDKRFTLLNAPTGTGKSLIYMTAARMLDTRALVLTGTKGLQAQLSGDYEPIGLRDVRGQSNYRCVALDDELHGYGRTGAGCDEGPCHVGIFCSRKQEGGCPYFDAVAEAARAQLVVTNYAYWMTIGRFADPAILGEFGLLVLDEAHSAPDTLADFCAVELNEGEVRTLIGVDLPRADAGGVDAWGPWATAAYRTTREIYQAQRQDLLKAGSDKRRITHRLMQLTSLGRDLAELARAHEWHRSEPADPNVRVPGAAVDWVVESTKEGLKFSPVWAHAYAERYIFRSIPRIILASATLHRQIGKYLAIPKTQMDFREVGSGFDPARRPLYYVPTTTVDRNMVEGQVRLWINRIDAIIDGRLDRKGIIHARSYDRAQTILKRSRHRDIMVTNYPRTTAETVYRFKKAKAPMVLVSPSLEEGYDFPGDECRYQILAKVPFVDTRSPVVAARARSDKGYLNYLTSLSVVQQVGRGMRSADDYCENFIIDNHWDWFRAAARGLFPNWFRQSWRQVATVPPALRG